MYRIVYTKQAVKDIKNLKSVHLDEKAKKLIEVIKENPFKIHLHMRNYLVIYKVYIQEE